jgi:hypothetical protein
MINTQKKATPRKSYAACTYLMVANDDPATNRFEIARIDDRSSMEAA